MTEAQLQACVIDAAKRGGWLWWHDNDSRRNKAGFPDLVLLHAKTGRLVFAELKSATGRIRPEQQTWINALAWGGHLIYTWRPEHWHNGFILRVLLGEREVAA